MIGEKTYFRDGTLYGNIKVFSRGPGAQGRLREARAVLRLSLRLRAEEGVFEGQPYQYVAKNMRGNHVSSVRSGRMGSEVRVLDARGAARDGFRTAI